MADRQDLVAGERSFRDAASRYERLGRPVFAALSNLYAGVCAWGRGRRQEGRSQIEQACAQLEEYEAPSLGEAQCWRAALASLDGVASAADWLPESDDSVDADLRKVVLAVLSKQPLPAMTGGPEARLAHRLFSGLVEAGEAPKESKGA